MEEPESSIRNKDQSINFDFLFLSASSVVSPNGETKELKIKKFWVKCIKWDKFCRNKAGC
jgi:hypothetical protein